MNKQIELLGMKKINKSGLLATADVKQDTVTINQFRLMRNSKGEMWVDVPLLHWIDRGQHYYQKAVELNEEIMNKIERIIINEYNERYNSSVTLTNN